MAHLPASLKAATEPAFAGANSCRACALWQPCVARKTRRAGDALIDGERIGLRSVHNYKGSRLQSRVPVGYLLNADGVTVAAVELTDVNPVFLRLPDQPAAIRDATLTVALAIAVLRDPENSALED